MAGYRHVMLNCLFAVVLAAMLMARGMLPRPIDLPGITWRQIEEGVLLGSGIVYDNDPSFTCVSVSVF